MENGVNGRHARAVRDKTNDHHRNQERAYGFTPVKLDSCSRAQTDHREADHIAQSGTTCETQTADLAIQNKCDWYG